MTHHLFNTQPEIQAWLDVHGITNYTLTPHSQYGFTVGVQGDVDLSNQQLEFFAVQFSHVNGSFFCYNNFLTTLKGCPRSVSGKFDCSHNRLTSLDYAPHKVSSEFDCSHNQITTLETIEGLPLRIHEKFGCSHNQLTSLKGCPESVKKTFFCDHNQLTTLEFAPSHVGGSFYCHSNQLIDLTHCPQKVKGSFHCYDNPLLGNAQSIDNFQIIRNIHLQTIAIQKEQFLLDQNIAAHTVKRTSYLHKI